MSTLTIEAVDLKECRRCHEYKPTSEFSKDKSKRDGLTPLCRPCDTARRTLYAKEHPEAGWTADYIYRAHKYGNPAVVDPFTREQVIEMYGDECYWHSTGPTGAPFEELDHMVAIAAGGTHCLSNVRPSCGPCNRLDSHPAKVAKAKRESNIAAVRARQKALENAAAIASQSAIFSA